VSYDATQLGGVEGSPDSGLDGELQLDDGEFAVSRQGSLLKDDHLFRLILVLGKERRQVCLKLDRKPDLQFCFQASSLVEYLGLYKNCFYNWDRLVELIEEHQDV